jgi:hypothetical protein
VSRLAKLLDRSQVKLSLGGGDGSFSQPAHWTAPIGSFFSSAPPAKERIESSFEDYVRHAYKKNGIVFACIAARAMPFSEVRFQYQRLESGRPTDLFGGTELSILERPWPNGTTGELLWRMEQDASLAGNCYLTIVNGRIRRLRPDWVTIVSGVRNDPEASHLEMDAEVLAYIYEPKDGRRQVEPVMLTPAQVVHYSPVPDPEAQWRGMSWLTPVLTEIQADIEALTGDDLRRVFGVIEPRDGRFWLIVKDKIYVLHEMCS